MAVSENDEVQSAMAPIQAALMDARRRRDAAVKEISIRRANIAALRSKLLGSDGTRIAAATKAWQTRRIK